MNTNGLFKDDLPKNVRQTVLSPLKWEHMYNEWYLHVCIKGWISVLKIALADCLWRLSQSGSKLTNNKNSLLPLNRGDFLRRQENLVFIFPWQYQFIYYVSYLYYPSPPPTPPPRVNQARKCPLLILQVAPGEGRRHSGRQNHDSQHSWRSPLSRLPLPAPGLLKLKVLGFWR